MEYALQAWSLSSRVVLPLSTFWRQVLSHLFSRPQVSPVLPSSPISASGSWSTSHPGSDLEVRAGKAGMRKPERWPRPEAKSQLSARTSLSTTPNPDRYQAAPALRFKDPRGSPVCQGLRQRGHGKRKCPAQSHQVPLQAEHTGLWSLAWWQR